ncbi:MAG: HWE histidine kinase domain-containing protein [Luteibacter sp.]
MSEHATRPIDKAIAAGEREFRELADFAPVLIRRTGTDGMADWFNQRWLDFRGRSMAEEAGEGWGDGVHPDDLARRGTAFFEAIGAREPYSLEFRLRRHDGAYRWILETGTPFQRHGAFAGYWNSCTDITGQRVLIDELNHRMKNTLTVVQALAEQTFREGRPMAAAVACFGGRLRALATAQDRLVANAWEDVALREVVQATCAPLDPTGTRIQVDGPPLILSAETAVTLTMALHELLTNAVKYGALSRDTGHVAIAWSYTAPGRDRLRLEWKETGGPTVSAPAARGFGSRFIERGVACEPGGRSTLSFERDGVRWILETALPSSTASRTHVA